MLNTKNESERHVQSETNIELIFTHDTQGNKIKEDRVGKNTENKTKRPQFTKQWVYFLVFNSILDVGESLSTEV